MGARGFPPQRSELRVLKGDGKTKDAQGKTVQRQPLAVPGAPEMPDGLGEHGERAWRLVVPELVRLKILGPIDAITLEAWCHTYQLWKEHDGGRGYPALTASLTALGSKLGLDPAARLRMTIPEAADAQETDIFGPDRSAV